MRLIDILIALVVVVLLPWLLVIIFFWIKFESDGSPIFGQRRVGKNGNIFVCYKFRTMYLGTEEAASHLVSDTRVTPCGKHLRAWKLDELPQVWNLLMNEMSMVGPRPCMPNQVTLIAEREKRNVLSIKPGITGLSQINNIDMSDPVRLAMSDEQYLNSRSVFMDLKIIFLTVLGNGQGDKTIRS